MLLTRTLIALIANAPDDRLAPITQCGVKVLLSKELMVHDNVSLSQQMQCNKKHEKHKS